MPYENEHAVGSRIRANMKNLLVKIVRKKIKDAA